MKFRFHRWHIFAFLWLQVLLYPVIDNALDPDYAEIQWDEILRTWQNFVPFFVVFLFHNRIIVPRFLSRRRFWEYLISTVCLLAVFVLFQCFFKHDMPDRNADKAPDAREEVVGHAPPPRPDDVTMERPPRLRSDGERPPFPDRERKAPAYIMDLMIAILLLGCDLAVILLFRFQEEWEKNELLDKVNLQHELKYLKAQLNPHFLMNMLNNIHAMVEVNPMQAQEMIIDLSKLMRYTLYEGANQSVPLSHEAAFISNYVTLMKQRCSGKKINIHLALPDYIPDTMEVPPLLFIVFIENAFKHGISYRKPSFIDISLDIVNDRLLFVCENSFVRVLESGQPGGIGLENVRKRLSLLYGDDYTLRIESQSTIYHVTLNIPIYDKTNPMPGSGR